MLSTLPASILHELVFHENDEAMQFLIDHGIDMTIRDYRWNSTAEGWARYAAKNDRMGDFLAEAGARGVAILGREEEVEMNLSLKISIAFNGQCEAAFRFYEQCLSGTITYMLTWGNSPVAAEAPPGWHTKIYHATLQIGDAAITGGDPPPDRYKKPEGFSFLLGMDDSAAAERVFQALAENGRIEMPLQKTFWASRFGVLIDQFGVSWSINCE